MSLYLGMAQTVLHGVVAPCYSVDNKMTQLQLTKSEPLDQGIKCLVNCNNLKIDEEVNCK